MQSIKQMKITSSRSSVLDRTKWNGKAFNLNIPISLKDSSVSICGFPIKHAHRIICIPSSVHCSQNDSCTCYRNRSYRSLTLWFWKWAIWFTSLVPKAGPGICQSLINVAEPSIKSYHLPYSSCGPSSQTSVCMNSVNECSSFPKRT